MDTTTLRRSKRKATAVVERTRGNIVELKMTIKYSIKKFEGTAIHSEELKQPTRFNFENPNVSEEDCEYEYGDPVGWNIPQSQTSSSLKCDNSRWKYFFMYFSNIN